MTVTMVFRAFSKQSSQPEADLHAVADQQGRAWRTAASVLGWKDHAAGKHGTPGPHRGAASCHATTGPSPCPSLDRFIASVCNQVCSCLFRRSVQCKVAKIECNFGCNHVAHDAPVEVVPKHFGSRGPLHVRGLLSSAKRHC